MKKSSTELKRSAREALNGRYGISMIAFLINALIPFVLLAPFTFNISSTSSASQLTIYYLASLVISMISMILACGVMYFHVRLARENVCQISDVFCCFKRHPQKVVGMYLLLFLRLLPAVLPGSILLTLALEVFPTSAPLMGLAVIALIAGSILDVKIALQYRLIYYLFMDAPETKVNELFHQSRELMDGNKLRGLYLTLSFIGWYLLGVISFSIGFLWIMPYMSQTFARFYLDILEEKQGAQENAHHTYDYYQTQDSGSSTDYF